jgi:hypothetical protein
LEDNLREASFGGQFRRLVLEASFGGQFWRPVLEGSFRGQFRISPRIGLYSN